MTATIVQSYRTTNSLDSVTWNFYYQNLSFQQLFLLELNNLAAYNVNTNSQANTGTYGYDVNNQFYINTVGFTDYFLGTTSASGSNVNAIEYVNKTTGAVMIATGSFKYSGLPYISALTSANINGIIEIYPQDANKNQNINILAVNASY